MVTFVLIPGAGGVAWYWHRLVPLLECAGHEAIAVDLPADDERAGLSVYADRVVSAIGERREIVLVAQSLGGFTAPLVCARADVRMLVFVNAMIPVPGERVGAWSDATGATEARIAMAKRDGYMTEFDEATYFLHDVSPELIAEGESHLRDQTETVFAERCDFVVWPQIPIHVIAGRDDRLFPIEFQRRVARNRLHTAIHELPGGHLLALSNPHGLAALVFSLATSSHRSRVRHLPARA